MPNHFHLLFHQVEAKTIPKMMQGLVGSYGRYFNIKYKRSGPLLESRYKSSIILNDNYLLHASRYIHLNPDDYENWQWSSLPYYTKGWKAEWLQPEFVIELCRQHQGNYKNFVDEYKAKRDDINEERSKYLEEYDEPSVNYYTNPELRRFEK
jgi:putative transposase